jgi:hypothetical protein
MPPPIAKRRRIYNEKERAVMNPFKADFMKTTTPQERKQMAADLILPALFTYWSSCRMVFTPDEIDRRTEVSIFLKTSLHY